MIDGLNVSRETLDKLEKLQALLHKWNPKINLVAKSTIESSWDRHIRDSMQVYGLMNMTNKHWVDIGSGGGFPGLVVAIMGENDLSKVTLIESDQRKCAFLRTVLRETGVQGNVISERIEKTLPQNADILSARALANLSTLLEFAELHLAEDGICIFPKGENWEKEVTNARRSWSFSMETRTSLTDPNAVILKIGDLRRA